MIAKGRKRSQREIIKSALHSAIQWEWGFIDCMKGCTMPDDLETVRHSEQLIKEYRDVLKKKYGAGL